jgi:LacI family transcriptional regulator
VFVVNYAKPKNLGVRQHITIDRIALPTKIDLVKHRTRIALGVPTQYTYGRQIAMGIARFREHHLNWLFYETPDDSISDAPKFYFSGYIGFISNPEMGQRVRDAGIDYYVSVSNRSVEPILPQVINDDVAVGRMAAEYLLRKKFRNFLLVTFNHGFAHERVHGFLSVLNERGLPDPRILSFPAAIEHFPHEAPKPLAVFCVNDGLALKLMNHLVEKGVHIPADVAIMGVDNDDSSQLYSPIPITSIKLNGQEVGYRACGLLLKMIQQRKKSETVVRVPPIEIIERHSTASSQIVDARLRRALDFIERNYMSELPVDLLAESCNTSRRTLEMLFNEHLGTSPLHWINRVRLDKAELLLQVSDYTIERIAEMVGFEDRRNLYRAAQNAQRPKLSLLRKLKSQP